MAKVSSALLKRRLDIAEIVRKQGEIKVDKLSDMLQVSHVTIRHDLTYLEQQGYLKRSFGGAIYIVPEADLNRTTTPTSNNSTTIDSQIGLVKTCLSYINDGETIFLGHGNVIRKLIPFLHTKKSLKLIMNDISNAQLVKEFLDAEVILVGGALLDGNILYDPETVKVFLNQLTISHFIVELAAINKDNQVVIKNMEQLKTYQQILKITQHTIGILPQIVTYHKNNILGKLKHMDMVILSRPTVTEYHQQLLETNFKQYTTNKYCVTYHNITRGMK